MYLPLSLVGDNRRGSRRTGASEGVGCGREPVPAEGSSRSSSSGSPASALIAGVPIDRAPGDTGDAFGDRGAPAAEAPIAVPPMSDSSPIAGPRPIRALTDAESSFSISREP